MSAEINKDFFKLSNIPELGFQSIDQIRSELNSRSIAIGTKLEESVFCLENLKDKNQLIFLNRFNSVLLIPFLLAILFAIWGIYTSNWTLIFTPILPFFGPALTVNGIVNRLRWIFALGFFFSIYLLTTANNLIFPIFMFTFFFSTNVNYYMRAMMDSFIVNIALKSEESFVFLFENNALILKKGNEIYTASIIRLKRKQLEQ